VEIVGAVEIPSIVEIGKQLQLTELVIVCEDLLRDSSEQHAFAAREEVFHGEYGKSYMILIHCNSDNKFLVVLQATLLLLC